MNPRILVVEDDVVVMKTISEVLQSQGYKVSSASTAEEALIAIQEETPHLVLLDVGLPGFSGLELCRRLKNSPGTATLPVILVTSRGTEKQKVEGLDAGADDYVIKPFSSEELAARVRALLRRAYQTGPAGNVLRAKGIVLDLDGRTAVVNGKKADLNPKEFDVLAVLMKNPGQVLNRRRLAQAAWEPQVLATSHTINVTISNLRQKLGAFKKCIVAVTGIGYKFEEE